MNIQIADLKQRELALDPTQSFIVQAPAGSGKTSLLVQRYLMLLATVKFPEEVVAITFTRKAAREMQDRVIRALKNAAANLAPKNEYASTTQKLATNVLKQNQTQKWNIIKNPNRLRIQTIDSLCNSLVRQTPILTKFGIEPKILQNQEIENHYRNIARTILEDLTEPKYARYLETLLLHLDNDWQRAENLFITMLKSREQWLPHIVDLKNDTELRKTMESALETITQENLERCIELFPKDLEKELDTIRGQVLTTYNQRPNNKTKGCMLSRLDPLFTLLTKDFSWRKKVTKEQGFPAQASGETKEEKELFKTMKSRMENLLLKFSEHEDFRLSLENLLCSPPPSYKEQQWEMIEALLKLLPLLAAQLKVTFNKHNITDYAEISMAALQALGENDMPSELALNLDYRLQHLLVDEFQDTSVAQYRLIENLITTWQQDDGHTLFLVGDPMQSIYRFREAEVGLFLRAQNEGIGMLKLQSLTLTTNFRSSQNIVDWLNNNFEKILPKAADIGFGAVPFSSSTAIWQEQNSQVKVELLKNADATTEATHTVRTIKKLQQQNQNNSIAILVRTRSHLREIVASLRKNNLDYQAHELESLGENTAICDLFALTRAIYHPADRIAWLAILRAPWCGLGLKDLHTVANGAAEIIWDNICNHNELNLSKDGHKLVERLKQSLEPILAQRGRTSWRDLVEDAWLALGGPATVTDKIELEYSEVYLKLLETNSLDMELIQKKLYELYAPTTQSANIQIMTIHKAKGLEFDHVVIPGIDRITRVSERKLMLWFERPKLHGGSSLLLAPIEARGDETDPVYKYLQLVDQKKSFFETGRLLYVALTRAKKTLHIIGRGQVLTNDNQQLKTSKPQVVDCQALTPSIKKGSLLKQLEPCFNETWVIDAFEQLDNITPNKKIEPTQKLQRLNKDWTLPINIKTPRATNSPNWQLIDNQAAIIGTAIHQCLKQLSECARVVDCQDLTPWRKILLQLGYIDINHGVNLISEAIKFTLADERGKWILEKHEQAESELEITAKINGYPKNFIIDRTFIDKDGTRWIIDYKTATPGKKNIKEFLAEEQIKYRQQLTHYAAIMHQLDPTRPIKLGLYFPLCSEWVDMGSGLG